MPKIPGVWVAAPPYYLPLPYPIKKETPDKSRASSHGSKALGSIPTVALSSLLQEQI